MDIVTIGRAFFGTTLGVHILFALCGVGIPLLISIAEFIGIVRKDSDYTLMARRWTFTMATLFVTGAITGTIVAVTLQVLLPNFMAVASKVIMAPFNIEGFSFFIEAIFLGIYIYTWGRWKNPWKHWLVSIPLVIGSTSSAFLITTVNGFMNAPQGFSIVNGAVTNVNVWAAMFNSAMSTESLHSILAYYTTVSFLFAAAAAYALMRGRVAPEGVSVYRRKMLGFTLGLGLIFSASVVTFGHSSMTYLYVNDPIKFAGAEALTQTEVNPPVSIGGLYDAGTNSWKYEIPFPGMVNFLLGLPQNTPVAGLDAFPSQKRPPFFIRYFFDLMVIIGGFLLLTPLLFFTLRTWRPRAAYGRFMSTITFLAGLAAVLSVEFGWLLTEFGRQPYIIRNVMLTKDAFTTSPVVLVYATVLPIAYVVLGSLTVWVLIRHFRNNPLPA